MKTDKDLTVDITFEGDILKEEYFDLYDGIYTEISQMTGFDESTDLSTTYLGKMDMARDMIIKVEEKFSISRQGYANEMLLDNTECSTGGSCLSSTVVKLDCCLAEIFLTKFPCVIKFIIIIG